MPPSWAPFSACSVVGHRPRPAALGDRLELLAARAVLPFLALVLAPVHAGRALVDGVPAADLVAEDVDVVVERLGRRGGASASAKATAASTRAIASSSSLLDARRSSSTPSSTRRSPKRLERVALAPLRDLLLRAVLLGVGHRVAAEAVGDRLDQDRLALLARARAAPRRDGVGVEHVHAVAAHPGDAEALALACRSVTAEWRSSAVPMPNWLFVTMKTTGSFHSAARLSVSPNVPWFEAPSPNMQSVASSVPW